MFCKSHGESEKAPFWPSGKKPDFKFPRIFYMKIDSIKGEILYSLEKKDWIKAHDNLISRAKEFGVLDDGWIFFASIYKSGDFLEIIDVESERGV